jgi:hypothetical protein
MEAIKKLQWVEEDSWLATVANLLPLWLLSFAVMSEGFPRPLLSPGVAVISFIVAIVVSLLLLWKGWLAPDLLLYTFFPFVFFFILDEIHTSYKTPFILLCVLLLSAGMVAAQRSSSMTIRWLILLLVPIVAWVLASHAAQMYWQMVGDLGYVECMPGFEGCAPLTGTETPWWALFFKL